MPRRNLPDSLGETASRRTPYPWRLFWLLLVVAVCSYIGVLPYILALFAKLIRARETMSLPVLIAVQVLQGTILFGLAIGIGLLVADKVGVSTALLRQWVYRVPAENTLARGRLRAGAMLGAATGAVTLLLFYGFLARYFPNWPSEASVPAWKRLLACFYGAINEELLLRLFLLSLLLSACKKLARSTSRPGQVAFWITNAFVALIFGAAHVPAAAAFVPLTSMVIFSVMVVNAGAGAVFGYLAWSRGLEAAMIGHFTADFVVHMIGPFFAPS